MTPVIGLETRMLLRHFLSQGLSKAAIARRLDINERTIRRWIADGELDRDPNEVPRYTPRPVKATKLDPFKDLIQTRLATYPELSSVRLMEEIRAGGYTGGYSQLKAYVSAIRPRPTPAPVIRFETPAAHQAQVDFAEFDFPWGKRYALLVVLGYSRLLWFRYYERQDMRTLFAGLEEAFRFFGDAHLDEERARWQERANDRLHATTKEVPRVRFERDEATLLTPLAERSYRSIVLGPMTPSAAARPSGDALPRFEIPKIEVERRPLSVYAAAYGGL